MVGVGIAGARDRPAAPDPLRVVEQAWGRSAVDLVVVVRALLAAQLGLRARDPLLDDLTQEVVRRALDGRQRARAGAPLRPWLLGIARHVAIDEARRRRRLVALADDETGVGAFSEPAPDPEQLALCAQRRELVNARLAELPETWRRALLLFHVEDLSYTEIARALSVPMGTVATWISRGRAQLAEKLAEEAEVWGAEATVPRKRKENRR